MLDPSPATQTATQIAVQAVATWCDEVQELADALRASLPDEDVPLGGGEVDDPDDEQTQPMSTVRPHG